MTGRGSAGGLATVTVVGASLAGLHAARELRAQGYDGRLVVVGAEPHAPYDRPPLSKGFLTGASPEASLALTDGEEMAALDAEWRLGVAASALDPRDRAVLLSDGRRVPTDGVVIATGATARPLPGPRYAGVHTLRTLDDARALRGELTNGTRRVVIIGGGFIGAETASSCVALGHHVTVVEAAPLPLVPQLGPDMAAFCADLHRRGGARLLTGTSVARLRSTTGGTSPHPGADAGRTPLGPLGADAVRTPLGSLGADTTLPYSGAGPAPLLPDADPAPLRISADPAPLLPGTGSTPPRTGAGPALLPANSGAPDRPEAPGRVTAVELADGRLLPADVVVVGIGALPNTAWLANSGLPLRDGVLCDEGCVTPLPQVVAVGDVARVNGARAEHWTSATEQPRVAVRNLLAGHTVESVTALPYFWSDQYGSRIQFAGHRHPDATVRVVEGDPGEGAFLAVYEHEGRPTAALAVDLPRPFLRVWRELRARHAAVAGGGDRSPGGRAEPYEVRGALGSRTAQARAGPGGLVSRGREPRAGGRTQEGGGLDPRRGRRSGGGRGARAAGRGTRQEWDS
ncbi:FAD-dependent oxidoreductase [Streptomyces sp. G45]|uniref:NAD(P)/FAD-dependent oxidoreductase n=1 Tax=Streptomyces sp. G45 TaxID=3406627 RepID=UPI003C15A659